MLLIDFVNQQIRPTSRFYLTWDKRVPLSIFYIGLISDE